MRARMGNFGVATMLLALALLTLSLVGCSQGTFAAGADRPESSAGSGGAPGQPGAGQPTAQWAGRSGGSLSTGDPVGSATVRYEGYLSDENDEQP